MSEQGRGEEEPRSAVGEPMIPGVESDHADLIRDISDLSRKVSRLEDAVINLGEVCYKLRDDVDKLIRNHQGNNN
jgi:hypothetical protein